MSALNQIWATIQKLPLGDVATWVAGIATVLTFIVAFIQIFIERNIRKNKENKEQAEHITAYISKEKDYKAEIVVSNLSPEPVYEFIVHIVAFQGAGMKRNVALLSVVPPGKSYITTEANYHGMSFHPSVEIAFRDINGRNWLRSGRGELQEIYKSPTDYYKFPRPLSWTLPK